MGQKAQLHPNARTCSIGLEVEPLTQYNPFSGLVGQFNTEAFAHVFFRISHLLFFLKSEIHGLPEQNICHILYLSPRPCTILLRMSRTVKRFS
jgi:hypothetical protein